MRSQAFYMGTLQMGKPWYARTIKSGAFPDKGPGEYWYDYKGFYLSGKRAVQGS